MLHIVDENTTWLRCCQIRWPNRLTFWSRHFCCLYSNIIKNVCGFKLSSLQKKRKNYLSVSNHHGWFIQTCYSYVRHNTHMYNWIFYSVDVYWIWEFSNWEQNRRIVKCNDPYRIRYFTGQKASSGFVDLRRALEKPRWYNSSMSYYF